MDAPPWGIVLTPIWWVIEVALQVIPLLAGTFGPLAIYRRRVPEANRQTVATDFLQIGLVVFGFALGVVATVLIHMWLNPYCCR